MRLQFRCEKCGHTEPLSDVIVADSHGNVPVRELVEFMRRSCPKCAKLTYGPLTEEMVAEALRIAAFGEPRSTWRDTSLAEEFGKQARFVLRLLDLIGADMNSRQYGCIQTREELLDLARQK